MSEASSVSPGEQLLVTASVELLSILQTKPSRPGIDRPAPIAKASATDLTLSSHASVIEVFGAVKGLIAGIVEGAIQPAHFLQPSDCHFSPMLLLLVSAFSKLESLGKKLYFAESENSTKPIESLLELQALMSANKGKKVVTSFRDDELIFAFL